MTIREIFEAGFVYARMRPMSTLEEAWEIWNEVRERAKTRSALVKELEVKLPLDE